MYLPLLFKDHKVKKEPQLLFKKNQLLKRNKSLQNLKHLKWTLRLLWICKKSVHIMETRPRNMTGVKLFKRLLFKFLYLLGPPQNRWISKLSQKNYLSKSNHKTNLWSTVLSKKKSKLKILSGALRTRNLSKSLLKKLTKLSGKLWFLAIKKSTRRLLTTQKK